VFGVHLSSSFESRGVVRLSLFLCAALPVIFSAGPFFTFRLGFALAAFALLGHHNPPLLGSFDNCGLLRAMNSRRLMAIHPERAG
jgi:hypothetical protein